MLHSKPTGQVFLAMYFLANENLTTATYLSNHNPLPDVSNTISGALALLEIFALHKKIDKNHIPCTSNNLPAWFFSKGKQLKKSVKFTP